MIREPIAFRSGDAECAGWTLRPDAAEPSGCVVLAHGFGAVKEGRLEAYAERFAAAGHGAVAFDYRHFGASGGEPRQLLDIAGQQADLRAAVGHARSLDWVDAARVAVWGTSYGGGHALAVAASDPGLRAAIAQVPHADGLATMRALGPLAAARLGAAGLRDQLGALAGRDPHLIPVVGPPGSLAAITAPGADEGYRRIFPEDFAWRNEVAARATLRVGTFSPARRAASIDCPLLVQVATDDAVTPPAPAIRAAERAPLGELRAYPGGHFDPYVGELFERVVGDQLDFLERRL